MLVIRAVAFKGRPIDRDISGQFGEAGGTIGRGESSTLVLPDPERYISRTHAAVSYQVGGYIITDNSSKNPIRLNGRPLGPGAQARLSHGDRIDIGDYALEVALPAGSDQQREAFGGVSSREGDPFESLLKPPAAAPPPRAPAPALPWPDAPAVTPPARPRAGRRDDPLGDLRGPEPSIDDIINPAGAPRADRSPTDPLDSLSTAGKTPGTVDPLELLGGPPRPVTPRSVPDHGAEIFTPFTPPVSRPDPALDALVNPPPAAPSSSPPPESPAPPGPVVRGPDVTPSPPPSVSGVSAMRPGDDALLQAFVKGAGLTNARLTGLTPETMEVVGALLREAVQGTLDLLRARGLTKSEFRADVTMVMGTDNNPLKFSPSAEAALTHFLATPVPGFMPPLRAMREAYDDLRAHQLGFLAGMRAALDDVLNRFSPDTLDDHVPPAGALDSVMPNRRKARLWELFVDRHTEVADAAREDFNAVFGKAFVRAYQAQVKQLRGDAGGPASTPSPRR